MIQRLQHSYAVLGNIKSNNVSIHTGVVKLAAVVGRGEERDELPLGEELVAVLDDLVRAADQVELVLR